MALTQEHHDIAAAIDKAVSQGNRINPA